MILSFLFFCSACSVLETDSSGSPAKVVDYQLSFEEVLSEINESHKAVEKSAFDMEAFEAKYVREKEPREFKLEKPQGPEQAGYLSVGQMKRDAYVLINNLRTGYSLYDYYGGDERFDAALAEIEAAVSKTGEMTTQDFNKLLCETLSFIDDRHFSIGGWNFSPRIVTAFYRGVDFGKIDGNYVNLETGKEVKSVEGFPDLDLLFHLSLSDDHKLVYYPIIQIPIPFLELSEKYYKGTTKEPADMIKVTYSDDSTQTLFGFQDYRSLFLNAHKEADIHETEGMPVLRTTAFDTATQRDLMMRFLDEYGSSSSMIVDLRENGGGYTWVAAQWFEGYTGGTVSRNADAVFFESYEEAILNLNSLNSPMKDYYRAINEQYSATGGETDVFIDNPHRLLIVLSSKLTASTAEVFIDYGHNVENVLFVGDASGGCMINNRAYSSIKLPYSYLSISMGTAASVFPDEEYFREGRGFLPDIWVPAEEAEDLICGYLKKMTE